MSSYKTLYYDASCGLCHREIEHLRLRLEKAGITLTNITAPDFIPPEGYRLETMLARIHFYDGTVMLIGLDATIAYWRLSGSALGRIARLLALPGLFHVAKVAYELWANWRIRKQTC